MKNKLFTAAAVCMIFCGISAHAAVINAVYSTDIGVLIDNQPIRAYNISGSMYVIAEELRSYGFDVIWSDADRTLKISRNGELAKTSLGISDINIKKSEASVHQKLYDVYSTDIKTYISDDVVDSCAIDGQTLIKVRELERYGTVDYDDTARIANVEIAKPCLEWDYDNADKQELVIDADTTYIGQVKDGIPYGVGKLTSVERNQELKEQTRSMHHDFTAWERRNTYDTADLVTEKLGYFIDGQTVETMYTTQDKRVGVYDNPQQVKDYIFKRVSLEYYSEGDVICGSCIITGDEYGWYSSYQKLDDGTSYLREDYKYENGNKYGYVINLDSEYIYGIRVTDFKLNDKSSAVMPYTEPPVFKKLCGRNAAIDKNNNLYVWNADYAHVTFKQPVYIRRNIKACSAAMSADKVWSAGTWRDLHYYILSCDNKLYRTTDLTDESKDILIAENVRLFKNDSHAVYITDENDTLYKIVDYDWDTYTAAETFPLVELKNNVKDFCFLGDVEQIMTIGTETEYTDVFHTVANKKVEEVYHTTVNAEGRLSKDGVLEINGKVTDSGITDLAHDTLNHMFSYVKADGSLWYYGDKNYDAEANAIMPKKLADSGFVKAGASYWSVFGLKEDGSLWEWYENSETGEPVKLADDVKDFVCNRQETTVLLNTGRIISVTNEGEVTEYNLPGTMVPLKLKNK
ncbi:MAG: hypothetical protein ACI4DP_01780 [Candidatus Ornithomonoglobus sp.]